MKSQGQEQPIKDLHGQLRELFLFSLFALTPGQGSATLRASNNKAKAHLGETSHIKTEQPNPFHAGHT